jgi:hypothetical protein
MLIHLSSSPSPHLVHPEVLPRVLAFLRSPLLLQGGLVVQSLGALFRTLLLIKCDLFGFDKLMTDLLQTVAVRYAFTSLNKYARIFHFRQSANASDSCVHQGTPLTRFTLPSICAFHPQADSSKQSLHAVAECVASVALASPHLVASDEVIDHAAASAANLKQTVAVFLQQVLDERVPSHVRIDINRRMLMI